MRQIPFSPPDISQNEIDKVVDVLRSGWITTGSQTKKFEKQTAEYCGTEKAVCLNSATACLELTLRLFGIGSGDEIITTAYTYTASASVACHVGAKLVLVDVAPGSFHIDYDKLADAITDKTKAIIPVDIAGVMCDYDRIVHIAESKKALFHANNKYQEALGRVLVMADSAHGFGAEYNNARSGSCADFTCFSFHAVKNLTTAEGGAVTWKPLPGIDSEEIYREFMLFSLHGQSKDALAKTKLGAWEYDIVSTAYKCNMTDISAAIGLGQLERYGNILQKRRSLIECYDKGFANENASVLRHFTYTYKSSGHLYLMRLSGKDSSFRNEFIIKMAECGVACNVHYKPLPMHTAYKKLGFDITDYPNAYAMFENEVTLPLNSLMSIEDAEYVVACAKKLLGD